MSLEQRARVHQALGDARRLAVVDALALSDHSPRELQEVVGLPSNLLAFHLDVLEAAGLISRHVSHGDRRRRYVTLHEDALAGLRSPGRSVEMGDGPALFVCSGNSARSQLAAALWSARTGRDGLSAGMDPAARVHRHAVEVARRHGLDLTGAAPRGYDEIEVSPGLVVSVCDRAREAGLPFDVPLLHWSVADPAEGGIGEFQRAYAQLSRRVDLLAEMVAA